MQPTHTQLMQSHLNGGAPDYTVFEIRRNTGSYTEDAAIDLVNGSSYVTADNQPHCFTEETKTNLKQLRYLDAGQQYLNGNCQGYERQVLVLPIQLQLSAVR
jgi:hypothetical protein